MRIVLDTTPEHGGAFKVHADDGQGHLWTPDPERALAEVAGRLRRFAAADLALRRDGVRQHIRVCAGTCPTCGLPAPDCVGVPLDVRLYAIRYTLTSEEDGPRFWSNTDGWVAQGGDVFSADERMAFRLPVGGEWVCSDCRRNFDDPGGECAACR